jgi:hypothetical protein
MVGGEIQMERKFNLFQLLQRKPKPVEPPPELVSEPTTIQVNRSVVIPSARYPDGFKKLIHPEFEAKGPAKYNLRTGVQEWFYGNQGKEGNFVDGQAIYKHLETSGELLFHFGLADLLVIQMVGGIGILHELFFGKDVFGWRSVAQFSRDDDIRVPCLCEIDGSAVITFRWVMGCKWGPKDPALRFNNEVLVGT